MPLGATVTGLKLLAMAIPPGTRWSGACRACADAFSNAFRPSSHWPAARRERPYGTGAEARVAVAILICTTRKKTIISVAYDDDERHAIEPHAASRGFRAARRWRAWRFHVGGARPPARGAVAAHRRHLGHVGGSDECRGADRRPRRRGRRRRARRAGKFLATGIAGGVVEPAAAHSARRAARPLDARPFAGLRRDGPDGALVLALRSQPGRRKSLAQYPGRDRRFRSVGASVDQALRHRDQRPHGAWPGLPKQRNHARRAARVGLPPHAVPGDRDRWRKLLGRRLFRQSHHHAAGTGM